MKRSIFKTTRKLALEFEVPETTRTYNEKCHQRILNGAPEVICVSGDTGRMRRLMGK